MLAVVPDPIGLETVGVARIMVPISVVIREEKLQQSAPPG
jgi:hypothetical protein